MPEINVEASYEKINNVLSDGYSMMMLEAFLVCMTSQDKTSGSILSPYNAEDNLLSEEYSIIWEKVVDERMKRSHNNENQTTDFGSMYISLILIEEVDEIQKVIEDCNYGYVTSVVGSGIDFWLSKIDEPLNFKARIEISGIRRAAPTNNIDTRRRIKEQQVTKSDNTELPAFISIVEFSNVESLIIEK